MRILWFLLRVYRFPVPELLIVGLTVLSLLNLGVAGASFEAMRAIDYAAALSAIPSFASLLVLLVFLWEFLGALRTPLANTILSLPVSRLDLYATYVVGAVATPLVILAAPLLVSYVATAPYPLAGAAPAIAAILASAALYYAAAACAGILSKSRGLAVAVAILSWLSSPIIAALVLQAAGNTLASQDTTLLYAAAMLNPPMAIIRSASLPVTIGSRIDVVLSTAAILDAVAAAGFIVLTGWLVARRWEPV